MWWGDWEKGLASGHLLKAESSLLYNGWDVGSLGEDVAGVACGFFLSEIILYLSWSVRLLFPHITIPHKLRYSKCHSYLKPSCMPTRHCFSWGPTQLPLEQAQQIKEKTEVGEAESPGGKNNTYWALGLSTCHAFAGASEILWKGRFREESWCGPQVSALLTRCWCCDSVDSILDAKVWYWVILIDALISKWDFYTRFKDGESEVVRG